MLFYLIAFVVAVFLIRIPLLLLGMLFRFSKPISLIGFGALLGITFTTGGPDLSLILNEEGTQAPESHPSRAPEEEESPIPRLLEAANDATKGLQREFIEAVVDLEASWRESAAERIRTARTSAEGEYKSLSKGLQRKRS